MKEYYELRRNAKKRRVTHKLIAEYMTKATGHHVGRQTIAKWLIKRGKPSARKIPGWAKNAIRAMRYAHIESPEMEFDCRLLNSRAERKGQK